MRLFLAFSLVCGLLFLAVSSLAQPPGPGREGPPRPSVADDLVTRLMEFDTDKDGKLTKRELTDERLHRLFDRADADKDGTVTKEELTALAAREPVDDRGGRAGGPPPGGPGMGPFRPGEVLSAMIRQRLQLAPEQEQQLDELQNDVDAKLAKILNDEQKAQLKAMRDRGPGRPGGFGPTGKAARSDRE